MFHGVVFLESDQRAGAFLAQFFQTGQHAQLDLVFAGKFDRADLQYLGAKAGHFQHFLEGDGVQTTCLRDDARVGGVDAVDIGIDLAFVSLQGSGQRHASGVGAAAPQGGDGTTAVDALEAGNDDDLAGIEIGAHGLVFDIEDARLGVGVVRQDLDLATGVGLGGNADVLECHGQQADGDLFTGGDDDIEFARVRNGLHGLGQVDQAICFATHGRDHDDQLMAFLLPFGHAAGDIFDALGSGHRSATIFLNYECHLLSSVPD